MQLRFVLGKEKTGGFDHVISANFAPLQLCGIFFSGNADFFAVDDQVSVFHFDATGEFAMNRVIAELIRDVINFHQIVDGDNFDVFPFHCGAENQTADTAKTIDTNFDSHLLLSFFIYFKVLKLYNPG